MMLVLLSLMTGMLGLYLNYRVLKDMDWKSKPYSFYRHFQFLLAGLGAATWSYCLLGFMTASLTSVVLLALVVTPILVIQYKVGSEGICLPFEVVYYRMKDKICR